MSPLPLFYNIPNTSSNQCANPQIPSLFLLLPSFLVIILLLLQCPGLILWFVASPHQTSQSGLWVKLSCDKLVVIVGARDTRLVPVMTSKASSMQASGVWGVHPATLLGPGHPVKTPGMLVLRTWQPSFIWYWFSQRAVEVSSPPAHFSTLPKPQRKPLCPELLLHVLSSSDSSVLLSAAALASRLQLSSWRSPLPTSCSLFVSVQDWDLAKASSAKDCKDPPHDSEASWCVPLPSASPTLKMSFFHLLQCPDDAWQSGWPGLVFFGLF